MLLNELFYTPKIYEARSNPGQNVKLSGHPAAVKFLQGKDLNRYGVSMTSIPKLGINPGSNYNTPVGIYFYPAEFYMSIKSKNSSNKLPFVDDAKYIQIFKLNGNTIDINLLNSGQFKSYISNLYNNIHKIARLVGESENNTQKMLNNAIAGSISQAAHSDLYGGRLWYILYVISNSIYGKDDKDDAADDFDGFDESISDNLLEANKRGAAAPRSSVIWNSLLRILGIDCAIDTGAGIIHKNEPYQGVVLNPRVVTHAETIHNNEAKKINTTKNEFVNLSNMKVDDYYIDNVIQYVRDLELKYDPLVRQYCKKIIGNVLDYLRKWPSYYKRLYIDGINIILRLTKDPKVKKELMVGYYTAKFPKVKTDLEDMLEDWTFIKQEFRPDLPEANKKKAHARAVPPYKVDQATGIIQDLRPFKADPEVAAMIKYLNDMIAALQY